MEKSEINCIDSSCRIKPPSSLNQADELLCTKILELCMDPLDEAKIARIKSIYEKLGPSGQEKAVFLASTTGVNLLQTLSLEGGE